MLEQKLSQLMGRIGPADRDAMDRARQRWDSIAKPLDGLGVLEDMVVRIAGAQGSEAVELSDKTVAVFCADNGVVAEGVTQTGQEVTAAVARSMARRRSCVCRMARVAGAKVVPVDIGMAQPVEVKGLLQRAVRRGTDNIAVGPAMSREQAVQGLMVGIELAMDLAGRGSGLLATGEMGIGNTTTAAAVSAVLLRRAPEEVTGRGAGLSDAGLAAKRRAVARALEVNRPDPADPLDVLSKVGGLDIAGMAGLCLGGAMCRVPVLLDGVISAAAALIAVRLCPKAAGFLLASHLPAEPAGGWLLAQLGLTAPITARLKLGEGTGAVAAMPLLDMALAVYHGMSSFQAMDIAPYARMAPEKE